MTRSSPRIAVISGSARDRNSTLKAARHVASELSQLGGDVTIVDPRDYPGLGIDLNAGPDGERLNATLRSVDAFVVTTPEYHGSYSSAVKLVIDNLGFPSALKEKPVALVGVAAGVIGAIKALEHLRSVCSHVGAIVLPGPVSVARVEEAFDEAGTCIDDAVKKRLDRLARQLMDYTLRYVCPPTCTEQLVRGADGV